MEAKIKKIIEKSGAKIMGIRILGKYIHIYTKNIYGEKIIEIMIKAGFSININEEGEYYEFGKCYKIVAKA